MIFFINLKNTNFTYLAYKADDRYTMDAPHKYTVEEVLEIALALKPDERKLLQAEIEKSLFSEQEVLNRITPYHKKYEATYTLLKN